ncbi:DUF1194 domain-containing protein [Pseudoruegeria sp. HB172150]|uniref:DUF1194 domain-containing protein n=1 Tax=Pseudoruegeria sp. HB172150 TaxID=2721164 RepID=UPI001554C760|nr:DUF1194 domain-containing protein [Pseudoruegeria sp. HB172150]
MVKGLAAALGLALAFATPVQALCRQALALAVDVSGSVDGFEYRLQRQGLASALVAPEVQAAFLSVPGAPVRLYVYEWAGSDLQRELVGWTEIDSAAALNSVAERLLSAPRSTGPSGTSTGQAMLFGALQLESQRDCGKLVLDIATDGISNAGPEPRQVRMLPEFRDITINGMAIGAGWVNVTPMRGGAMDPLLDFLTGEVIHGPGAFVEVAVDYSDFREAMRRKLLREVMVWIVGDVPPAPRRPAG